MMPAPNHLILSYDSAGIWCAAPFDFRDFVFDPTGWGPTREDAIEALLDHPEFQERARRNKWPKPRQSDFIEIAKPLGAQFASNSRKESAGYSAALRRQSFKVISNR